MAKRRTTHRKPKTTDKPGLPKHESKLSTNIPEDVHRKLKAVAALRGISIRELLIEYADSLVLEAPKSGRRSLCFEGRFPEITKIPPGTPPRGSSGRGTRVRSREGKIGFNALLAHWQESRPTDLPHVHEGRWTQPTGKPNLQKMQLGVLANFR